MKKRGWFRRKKKLVSRGEGAKETDALEEEKHKEKEFVEEEEEEEKELVEE